MNEEIVQDKVENDYKVFLIWLSLIARELDKKWFIKQFIVL